MFYSSAGNWHQKLAPATGTRKLVSVYGPLARIFRARMHYTVAQESDDVFTHHLLICQHVVIVAVCCDFSYVLHFCVEIRKLNITHCT